MIFKEPKENTDTVKRTTFYCSRFLLKDFKKIVAAEGENVSEKIRKFMQAYVEEHKPGNPQLKMIHYVKSEEQQPMKVQCDYIRGALSNGQVFCRRKGMWIPGVTCYSCPKNWMGKK